MNEIPTDSPFNPNIAQEYQHIIKDYQDILNQLDNENINNPNYNWLIIVGSVFSFFVLLFILSSIIKN